MTKTVKQHTEETDRMIAHLKDGEKLVVKLREQLSETRNALKFIEDFAHPAFQKKVGYSRFGFEKGESVVTMKQVIEKQISNINAILGDAA